MCGIIGFSGEGDALEVLLSGLRALSYRGYDSAGITLSGNALQTIKAAGRIENLEEKVKTTKTTPAHCGIGHTRWATHGAPTDVNAHPQTTENLSLVHNGIIENCSEISKMLMNNGYSFVSETDTEAAACLIDYYYRKTHDPALAIFNAVKIIRGSFAFGLIFADFPQKIFAIRRDNPLIVAKNEHASFIASDITALAGRAEYACRPDDGILAVLSGNEIKFYNSDMLEQNIEIKPIENTGDIAECTGYSHFMLKEIHEEPEVIRRTVASCTKNDMPYFQTELLSPENLKKIKRLHIIGCGTAMHAGLIGKNVIEKLAGLPVSVELSSEFRYEHPIIEKDELVVLISQSGETADTLAALRYVKNVGVPILSVVNVPESSIAAESDGVIHTYAGPEIAVASTKAYMVQCAVMYVLAAHIAHVNGKISDNQTSDICKMLVNEVPEAIGSIIKTKQEISDFTNSIINAESLFYIGRCNDYAICAEGSLKLKEISYIHSEAFPAGELKHGTISLLTEQTPVIALLTTSEIYEKTVSGMREASARGANMLAICASDAHKAINVPCTATIVLPKIPELFAVFPAASVMQLIAYYTALKRGNDVDKPRNLAKSVTVE